MAGKDLAVSVERATVPLRVSLPTSIIDVKAPRIFVVAEGAAQWALLGFEQATLPAAVPFDREQANWFRTLGAGEQFQLRNDEDQPLVYFR